MGRFCRVGSLKTFPTLERIFKPLFTIQIQSMSKDKKRYSKLLRNGQPLVAACKTSEVINLVDEPVTLTRNGTLKLTDKQRLKVKLQKEEKDDDESDSNWSMDGLWDDDDEAEVDSNVLYSTNIPTLFRNFLSQTFPDSIRLFEGMEAKFQDYTSVIGQVIAQCRLDKEHFPLVYTHFMMPRDRKIPVQTLLEFFAHAWQYFYRKHCICQMLIDGTAQENWKLPRDIFIGSKLNGPLYRGSCFAIEGYVDVALTNMEEKEKSLKKLPRNARDQVSSMYRLFVFLSL
jgi:hypothetical protein